MHVLIAQSNENLGMLWKQHLERLCAHVTLVQTSDAAIAALAEQEFDVIVLDLVLREGSALAVADVANYRQPRANVVFVTNTTFFSDGSIFNHSPNARAFIESTTAPNDLAAIVEYYGQPSPDRAAQ
ncbi:Response regulator receiver domain-containing protein [Yoonia tamlensis]|uniref:Response regulator receiver domain-containing protein n=1 Tax=Yoonia tamlensis TaxID=390270 RepID=A0A1I6FPG4_9RHOB|nr:response regulator [Yoonia tamlensis]SFR31835.1 Response regulator receiver domain-containing protein [Yoonia tamlensis]